MSLESIILGVGIGAAIVAAYVIITGYIDELKNRVRYWRTRYYRATPERKWVFSADVECSRHGKTSQTLIVDASTEEDARIAASDATAYDHYLLNNHPACAPVVSDLRLLRIEPIDAEHEKILSLA